MVRYFHLITVYSLVSPDLFGFVCLHCLFVLGLENKAKSYL